MKRPILLGFTLILFSGLLRAQSISPSVISSSGAFFSNSNGMLSSTIGELSVVETFTSGNSILTQGFQQAFDFVNAIENIPSPNEISIYPNPTSEKINIHIPEALIGVLEVNIYDAIGKMVFIHNTFLNPSSNNINLDIHQLTNGVYLIEVKSKVKIYYNKFNVLK